MLLLGIPIHSQTPRSSLTGVHVLLYYMSEARTQEGTAGKSDSVGQLIIKGSTCAHPNFLGSGGRIRTCDFWGYEPEELLLRVSVTQIDGMLY